MRKTCQITVYGLVQGIGYRPYVAEMAEELYITGTVKNAGGIVQIDASGACEAVDAFIHRLRFFPPKGARIDQVLVEEVEDKTEHFTKFSIIQSTHANSEKIRFLPADLPVCDSCVKELQDPSNRRYRYPFISCVSCGPRYSILEEIPYDRENITMKDFVMCKDCQKEYTQNGNIRRHAQTISCHNCGPKLKAKTADGQVCYKEEALQMAIRYIKQGRIVAVKDIGGYHFAFRPDISEPSMRLREFKNRERKPFAVMFLHMAEIEEYCEVSETEKTLLQSPARPIVLLKKKKDFAYEVCGESDRMGVMLWCNPLQILLLEKTGPLVMTSGNRGGEPIITSDDEMEALMEVSGPDLVLSHDRPIRTPLDDSIYQVVSMPHSKEEKIQILRRARGLVPEPILLHRTLPLETFAAGGDLKAVFALGKDNAVYLSQHFGDLEDWKAQKARTDAICHMEQLLHIEPQSMVADLHPAYVSAKGVTKRYQHHHAHVAAVMAEYGLEGPVLGVCFDGTGYGMDHSIWGSEFLVCKQNHFERKGSLKPVKLIGGDAGARNAKTILQAFLYAIKETNKENIEFSQYQNALIEAAIVNEVNTITSSSMGRLFDAACALLEIKNYNSYEGECPIALEICASQATSYYPLQMEISKIDGRWQANGVKLIQNMWEAMEQKVDVCKIALGFHKAIADMVFTICNHILEEEEQKMPIALCGGTFYNRLLLQELVSLFEKSDRQVYINEKVPVGDGGIALGQMYLSTWEKGE